MSEMVERVAKALYLWQEGKSDWDAAEPESKEDAREAARAAIEAMREPTEAMIAVMAGYDWTGRFDHLPITRPIEDDVADCWNYMIDEALK